MQLSSADHRLLTLQVPRESQETSFHFHRATSRVKHQRHVVEDANWRLDAPFILTSRDEQIDVPSDSLVPCTVDFIDSIDSHPLVHCTVDVLCLSYCLGLFIMSCLHSAQSGTMEKLSWPSELHPRNRISAFASGLSLSYKGRIKGANSLCLSDK